MADIAPDPRLIPEYDPAVEAQTDLRTATRQQYALPTLALINANRAGLQASQAKLQGGIRLPTSTDYKSPSLSRRESQYMRGGMDDLAKRWRQFWTGIYNGANNRANEIALGSNKGSRLANMKPLTGYAGSTLQGAQANYAINNAQQARTKRQTTPAGQEPNWAVQAQLGNVLPGTQRGIPLGGHQTQADARQSVVASRVLTTKMNRMGIAPTEELPEDYYSSGYYGAGWGGSGGGGNDWVNWFRAMMWDI